MLRKLSAPLAFVVLAFAIMWIAPTPYVGAQDDPPAATKVETPPAPPEKSTEAAIEKAVDKAVNKIEVPTVPDEPTGDDIVAAVIKNVNDWKHGAWLAAVLGLAYLLVLLSKLKPIDALLKKHKVKWLRPILAAVFGGLAAAASAISIGEPPFGAIIAGVVAGLGSSGFHEVLSLRERRKAEINGGDS